MFHVRQSAISTVLCRFGTVIGRPEHEYSFARLARAEKNLRGIRTRHRVHKVALAVYAFRRLYRRIGVASLHQQSLVSSSFSSLEDAKERQLQRMPAVTDARYLLYNCFVLARCAFRSLLIRSANSSRSEGHFLWCPWLK